MAINFRIRTGVPSEKFRQLVAEADTPRVRRAMEEIKEEFRIGRTTGRVFSQQLENLLQTNFDIAVDELESRGIEVRDEEPDHLDMTNPTFG